MPASGPVETDLTAHPPVSDAGVGGSRRLLVAKDQSARKRASDSVAGTPSIRTKAVSPAYATRPSMQINVRRLL